MDLITIIVLLIIVGGGFYFAFWAIKQTLKEETSTKGNRRKRK